MDLIKRLETTAQRFGIEGLAEELRTSTANPLVSIGIVGEFSAGKSTLVNALTGNVDLMPRAVEPCTAACVTVVSGLVDEPKYFRQVDDDLEEIEKDGFNALARGNVSDRPLVVVPPTDLLPAGFRIVDTPGLGSLNAEHAAVTQRELPTLDAAVVCVDIKKGGLTAATVSFLKSGIARVLKERFFVALTRADRASKAEAEKVSAKVATEMARALGWTPDECRQRIAFVSCGPDAKGGPGLEAVRTLFERLFLESRSELTQAAMGRASREFLPRAIELLESHRAGLKGSDRDFVERRVAVEAQLADLRQQRERFHKQLDRTLDSIRQEARAITRAYESRFLEARGATDLETTGHELTQQLAAMISSHADDLQQSQTDWAGEATTDLVRGLQSTQAWVGMGKNIANMLAAAYLLPGGGAFNVVETLLPGLAKKLGTSFGKGAARSLIDGLERVITELNPLEVVSRIVGTQLMAKDLGGQLGRIEDQLVTKGRRVITELYEDRYFRPLERQARDMEQQLRTVATERRAAVREQESRIAELDAEIEALGAARKSV